MPGLAPAVAKLLGCNRAGAIDVNAACAGFLYAPRPGRRARRVRPRERSSSSCGAEALSRVTDPNDRGTAILFADGAAAVVVAAGELDRGLLAVRAALRRRARRPAVRRHATSACCGWRASEVYRHAVERMVEATQEALHARGHRPSTTSTCFVVHQANARIIEAAARRLGVPEEKVFVNVDTVANTSSASIPLALHQAEREGRLKPGDIVALAAFGGGFVWGAGVMSWKERVHATRLRAPSRS